MVYQLVAVLLDRGALHHSGERAGSGRWEWLEFYQPLATTQPSLFDTGDYRIDEISDLLSQSAEAWRWQANNLRQRLPEPCMNSWVFALPVYVMVTKADLLKGFRAWFADYDKAQRDQIWGFTLSVEQTKQLTMTWMRTQQNFPAANSVSTLAFRKPRSGA